MSFFTFCQNNSGGSFDADHGLFVVIEADNADHANQRAVEEEGLYFDGVQSGADCSCCGDRWYRAWDSNAATDSPMIYGKPATEYRPMIDWGLPFHVKVLYLNGTETKYPKEGQVT